MQERQDAQGRAIRNRADWQAVQDTLAQEMVERLTTLALADFDFQVHPRGLGLTTAREEATENVDRLVGDVLESVKSNLVSHYLMTRAKQRGAGS